MAWEPNPSSAPAPVRFDGAPPWAGGANCTGRFTPGAQRLGEVLRQQFPAVYQIQGYTCRPNSANTDEMSMHGSGRAIDVMVRKIAGEADPRGDTVANWLVAHAPEYGVQLIIWNHTMCGTARNPRGSHRAYTGPSSHTDHLHVEVNVAAAGVVAPRLVIPPPPPSEITQDSGGITVGKVLLAGAVVTVVGGVLYLGYSAYQSS